MTPSVLSTKSDRNWMCTRRWLTHKTTNKLDFPSSRNDRLLPLFPPEECHEQNLIKMSGRVRLRTVSFELKFSSFWSLVSVRYNAQRFLMEHPSDLVKWSTFSPIIFVNRQGTVLKAHGRRWSLWWGKWRRTHMNTRASAITLWRDICLYRRSVSTSSSSHTDGFYLKKNGIWLNLNFFLSSTIIFTFFVSLRLIRIYLGEVLLHVPSRAQEGHHGPVWSQIWRKNGEQVWTLKLNNKLRCLAKMTCRKLLISDGVWLCHFRPFDICTIRVSSSKLLSDLVPVRAGLWQCCPLSLLMISMDRISRYWPSGGRCHCWRTVSLWCS